MGRRKLFNGPLSSILTLITLLFLISFVVGQAPAPARSELPACKGISKDEFTAFNKSPNSPKVASCLCLFANSMASVFDNECSAVCVDQKLITDLNNQASQYKTAYKCDDKGNSILGSSSNLVGGSGNQTASAISNNINENNMVLGLSFMIGMVLFLIFN
ncbi:15862_t:CDS:2 [Rhizophagus irregularis]|nr:15862_t:CDS:2 [Rhizophagus irregularis]